MPYPNTHPEKRTDKNGRQVTRHVKNDTGGGRKGNPPPRSPALEAHISVLEARKQALQHEQDTLQATIDQFRAATQTRNAPLRPPTEREKFMLTDMKWHGVPNTLAYTNADGIKNPHIFKAVAEFQSALKSLEEELAYVVRTEQFADYLRTHYPNFLDDAMRGVQTLYQPSEQDEPGSRLARAGSIPTEADCEMVMDGYFNGTVVAPTDWGAAPTKWAGLSERVREHVTSMYSASVDATDVARRWVELDSSRPSGMLEVHWEEARRAFADSARTVGFVRGSHYSPEEGKPLNE